ncbi:opine metallophore biosynthesis dehydrogenase [Paenibacillus chitinolyticus]|uniref:opine metallophore biosynthesis dehydrogenase n=1 Tax=Paenibacillus chitinolyticus TaxID=79263 RepID=UPI0036DC4B8B
MTSPEQVVSPLGNTLIVGAGPAGVHIAVDVGRGWCARLGLANRKGAHSTRILNELSVQGYTLSSVIEIQSKRHLTGEVRLDDYYDGFDGIDDRWQTVILCTPSDSYSDVIGALRLENLSQVKRIVLLSPGIGSNLLVQSLVRSVGSDIEIISLSTYYGASRFAFEAGQSTVLRSIVRGLKRKVTAGSSKPDSRTISDIKRFIESLGIQFESVSHPAAAESRSITTYVHPAFFINEFSMSEIFSRTPSRKYMYKLYPEGPITPQAIKSMLLLWKEIGELVTRLHAEPINLLKFLNDDNYPVHETTLSREDIEGFTQADPVKQEYLLYIRYASILIDPFAEPDEQGRYPDFSAFPYKQISKDSEGKWIIPRVPYEDYKKIKLVERLGKKLNLSMPQTSAFIAQFESKLSSFVEEEGMEHFRHDLFTDTTESEADLILSGLELSWAAHATRHADLGIKVE